MNTSRILRSRVIVIRMITFANSVGREMYTVMIFDKDFVQKIFIVLFLLAANSLPVALLHGQSAPGKREAIKLPKLPVEEYRLKNGLRVILHRDASAPIVAVNVWYHVGSKNEEKGRTGFAHLFEHMMFQGSKNYNDDYFKPYQETGANINGTTNNDRTNYYEILPSNFLELALFMEADRMGGLLDAMTQEKLDNQRDVVKNERRQRIDNQPYGTAGEKINDEMYPTGNPYKWPVIGSMEDLSAASLDDVKAFFRKYYAPNNASLVIAGDFEPKQAKGWVEKYFGPIAKGESITRPSPVPGKISGEVRKTYEDAVQLPRVYITWHSSPRYSEDEAALDVLSLILANGRGSRLQSNLVYGKQLSQNASASNSTFEIAGLFSVAATAKQGKSLDEIEKEMISEIEKLKNEPPTLEEVQRTVTSIEATTIFGLEGVGSKADQLNGYATYLNKPDSFQADLERYQKVTPADVQRVAKKYLNGDRFVMQFVPRKSAAASKAQPVANKPTSGDGKPSAAVDYSANLPKPQPDPKLVLPSIEKRKLSNGLNVWIVQRDKLPIVSMNMIVKGGATNDPKERAGLASFTASLLNKGTKSRSAVDIANQLQSLGSGLELDSGWDSASIGTRSLTKNLDEVLGVYADVVSNSAFPEAEIETARKRMLTSLLQQKDDAGEIGARAFNNLVFGSEHPYGRSSDERSIAAITKAEVQSYYSSYYRPNNATLIVVGDVTADSLIPKLEKAFGGWAAGNSVNAETVSDANFNRPGVYIVDKPGAAQSVISIGQVGVKRSNPDYFALTIMNSILGGEFVSRLNLNLREEKGYTYGASSGFGFRIGAGPFRARAGVQTAVTKESIVEFMKELNGIRGAVPVTQKELDGSKQGIIRRYPGAFASSGGVANRLAELAVYGLPDTYFSEFIPSIQKVTADDVTRVAKKYLHPDKMAIVVVGDRKAIEPGLKELGYPVTNLEQK